MSGRHSPDSSPAPGPFRVSAGVPAHMDPTDVHLATCSPTTTTTTRDCSPQDIYVDAPPRTTTEDGTATAIDSPQRLAVSRPHNLSLPGLPPVEGDDAMFHESPAVISPFGATSGVAAVDAVARDELPAASDRTRSTPSEAEGVDQKKLNSKRMLLASLQAMRERCVSRLHKLGSTSPIRVFPVILSGKVALLQTLLENQIASVTDRDYNGCTPLHIAAHGGSEAMVLVLLSYGADVTALDRQGRTPLDVAHANGHSFVVRILLQAAAAESQQQAELQAPGRSEVFSGLDATTGGASSAFFSSPLAQSQSGGGGLVGLTTGPLAVAGVTPPAAGRSTAVTAGGSNTDPNNSSANNNLLLGGLSSPPTSGVPSPCVGPSPASGGSLPSSINAPPVVRTPQSSVPAPTQCPPPAAPAAAVAGAAAAAASPPSTTMSDCVPVVVCTVGLPGRGKSFISNHISRYLNWKGVACRVFNAGDYRRQLLGAEGTAAADFYNPDNEEGKAAREQMAELACADAARFINGSEVAVAVLDATNTTRERRAKLMAYFRTTTPGARILFIESVCTRQDVIRENILRAKFGNQDFKHVSNPQDVIDSFFSRISQYERVYESLDETREPGCSFIKIVNVKETIQLHRVQGIIPTRIAYLLLSLHPVAYPIFVARHGETVADVQGVFGGDRELTVAGESFAKHLTEFARHRAAAGTGLTVIYAGNDEATVATMGPLLRACNEDPEAMSGVNVVAEPRHLAEVNFGNLFNLSRPVARREHPRMFQRLFGHQQLAHHHRRTGSSGSSPTVAAADRPPAPLNATKAAGILSREPALVQVTVAESTDTVSGAGGMVSPAPPLGLSPAPVFGLVSSLGKTPPVSSPIFPSVAAAAAQAHPALRLIKATEEHVPLVSPSGGNTNEDPAVSVMLASTALSSGCGPLEACPLASRVPALQPSSVEAGLASPSGGSLVPTSPARASGSAARHSTTRFDRDTPLLARSTPPPEREGCVQAAVLSGIAPAMPISTNPPPPGRRVASVSAATPTPSAALMRPTTTTTTTETSFKYPAYNVAYPRGESTRQVVVRLEDVLTTAMRCAEPLLIVCPDTPARGLLAYLTGLAPEQTQLVRLPLHGVVEVSTKGDVLLHDASNFSAPLLAKPNASTCDPETAT